MPRDVTIQGTMSTHVATGCGVLGALLTLIAMWLVLQWRIVGPLQFQVLIARVPVSDELIDDIAASMAPELSPA
jgi:hypothetical protein